MYYKSINVLLPITKKKIAQ